MHYRLPLTVAMGLSVPEPCHEHQIPMLVHRLEHASGSPQAPELPVFATASYNALGAYELAPLRLTAEGGCPHISNLHRALSRSSGDLVQLLMARVKL